MQFVVGFGMANPKHLAILSQGVEAWNEWQSKTGEKADLSGANLNKTNFSNINFCSANLQDTNLQGSNIYNADLSVANLCGANLCRTNLRHANMSNADLSHVNLTTAHLTGVDLTGAILIGADLGSANLMEANLSETNLSEANLSNTTLINTNLRESNLSRANLESIDLGGTIFANVDLSTTVGLDSAKHHYPSSIGIDTLYKSNGKIPDVFLRGCGVPDSFIEQAKALIGAMEGIQFYSCFISYSGLDDEFARRLHGRLQQEHVRVWFAPHDIQGGKKLHEQIDEAIKVYDKLLILLSPNSLQSEWVMTELRKARKAERKTGKRKLFPVGLVDYATLQEWECFDADGGKDLAVEVREYFIPDFSNWKDHDAFEKGFARLLRDLKAEEKAAG